MCGIKGLHHKRNSYEITGRIVSVIKPFLTGRILKLVTNGQEIHAVVAQVSLLRRSFLIVYINDVSKIIVYSYADDTKVYVCRSKRDD